MSLRSHTAHEPASGARPIGATNETEAATGVQQMFDTIAPRYDLLNHTLSVGIDRWWWFRAARAFRPILQQPQALIVDLCCGTGDMTLALLKHRPLQQSCAPLLALDFSHQMLARGAHKFASHNIVSIEADALHLPLASKSVDLVTSAFGFRNLANYEEGLAEIHRVLRPGGQFGILDCNQPDGLTGTFYSLYFKKVLPFFGGLISGDRTAYDYLPASVERFPRPPHMLRLIGHAGFTDAAWTSYSFGTAGLYRATRP